MPRSIGYVYVHIVFSTKDRMPMIPESPGSLYEVIAHQIDILGGHLMCAGGTQDHVHILLNLGRSSSVSEHARNVKSTSSAFMHKTMPEFEWQDGYAAFSVSPQEVGKITTYIQRQIDHHHSEDYTSEMDRISAFMEALPIRSDH